MKKGSFIEYDRVRLFITKGVSIESIMFQL